MHDTFLFENIKKEVFAICEKIEIKKLTKMNVSVYEDSHVNEETLYHCLKETNNPLIGQWTKVEVEYNNPERLTAIINQVEGESFETSI
ncbi:MAG: hypothetical protein CVU84_01640 [Firmicutes bacterium HGW-Firmicutes-1]|jgi:Zn finger protein HypA/HybF involved in hydrogenase expression|nr:MAG: hypothetical protein CVU84_01640 [Firmicutes bacterium HGW-Firmicutes-1]